ncbi:MAG: hypothetical protein KJO05_09850 [Bacteroidia bacterium]|nr:hypothetical protein [Bacteroidia bacterium]NNF30197.1 hypothetical protein [Flavobacteriaceae bacterium]MBT8275480.1 hypothetical protein [Bacteroidia bacterium]NNJ81223.1 hypothetical protein [Flavobacteriaceae bacterium]NNK54412.1 hypothetical protein [Flavobacteriaceae bacterium]
MKKTKTSLILLLALTVTFSAGLWLYSTMDELTAFEYTAAGAVFITVIFAVILGLKRLKNEKKGLPADDELSMNIKIKAAASAFTFSIYLWTMMLMFTIDTYIESHILLGMGILGMGLLFVGFWVYYSKKGVDFGDKN